MTAVHHEITGRLSCRPDDPLALWVLQDDATPLGLYDLMREWIGQRVRVIAADGKDRRWVVIETREGEDVDG